MNLRRLISNHDQKEKAAVFVTVCYTATETNTMLSTYLVSWALEASAVIAKDRPSKPQQPADLSASTARPAGAFLRAGFDTRRRDVYLHKAIPISMLFFHLQ